MALRNDLGLLSEEYDPLAGRLVGNFPQAFSHVSLINSAFRLSGRDPLGLADDGSRVLVDNTLTSATVGKMKRLVRRRTGRADADRRTVAPTGVGRALHSRRNGSTVVMEVNEP